MSRKITREEFDIVVEAIWSELKYQNNLPRRTDDEAKDIPGFLTLLRRYIRIAEDDWADNPGEETPYGDVQVPKAQHDLRKLAAICARAMIYNGVKYRR